MNFLGQGRTHWIRVRMCILVVVMLMGVFAVAQGAWDLGVTKRDELMAKSANQYRKKISLPAKRGMITDRHGDEFAVEVQIDTISADPRKIKDPAKAAKDLADVLGMDEVLLYKKLTRKKLNGKLHHFSYLKRKVTPQVAAAVKGLEIFGVRTEKESKRYYPSRGLAAHVVGIVGMDAVGLEGLELAFDKQLRGRKEDVWGTIDRRSQIIFSDQVFGPTGVVGNTVELTIDRTLQHIVERELANTISTFSAKSGQIVVMDPHTGEVLAFANWPTYNPNVFRNSTVNDRRNRAALDVFEPGSTFKVFTLAAALNSGVVRPDDTIFCERGRWEMGDKKKVVIHDDHRDGRLSPAQCLKRSSNICFAKISQLFDKKFGTSRRQGKRMIDRYFRRFGFGDRTGIELPYESKGKLRPYEKWYDVDAAYISFGQGIGVTGIQMTTALSAIANGGVLMRPRLVRRIVGPDNETVQSFPPVKVRRVVSRYTAKLVGDIMTSVTEEGGTGTQGALDGFLVAGKTGTAQKAAPGKRGYHKDKWIASFFGFVPADNPRLVISVVIDEPLINHYGGTVAAPALRRIADKSLRYLGVSARSNRRINKNKAKSKPPIVTELVDSNEEIIEKAVLNEGQVFTPSLVGMSMKQSMDELEKAGLRPLFSGSGIAVGQIPASNQPSKSGSFVRVIFEPEKRLVEEIDILDEQPSSDENEENNADLI